MVSAAFCGRRSRPWCDICSNDGSSRWGDLGGVVFVFFEGRVDSKTTTTTTTTTTTAAAAAAAISKATRGGGYGVLCFFHMHGWYIVYLYCTDIQIRFQCIFLCFIEEHVFVLLPLCFGACHSFMSPSYAKSLGTKKGNHETTHQIWRCFAMMLLFLVISMICV